LDELERVLLVVREVAILKMLPLRAVSLFADTAYYPPFSFTTSVHSFEVCAAYSRVFPFNTEVHNMFVEVAIKSEGGNGGRKILPPPSLPIEPPTPTPNPQLPPSEPEPSTPEPSTPAPELPPIIPSPSPSPSPPPSPPISYVVRFKTRVVGYLRIFSVYAEKFVGDQRVAYGTAPEASIPSVYPFTGWEVTSLNYSADSLYKAFRFYFIPPGQSELWEEVVFEDDWNSDPEPEGTLLDLEVIYV
jgi:hypothetical protein